MGQGTHTKIAQLANSFDCPSKKCKFPQPIHLKFPIHLLAQHHPQQI